MGISSINNRQISSYCAENNNHKNNGISFCAQPRYNQAEKTVSNSQISSATRGKYVANISPNTQGTYSSPEVHIFSAKFAPEKTKTSGAHYIEYYKDLYEIVRQKERYINFDTVNIAKYIDKNIQKLTYEGCENSGHNGYKCMFADEKENKYIVSKDRNGMKITKLIYDEKKDAFVKAEFKANTNSLSNIDTLCRDIAQKNKEMLCKIDQNKDSRNECRYKKLLHDDKVSVNYMKTESYLENGQKKQRIIFGMSPKEGFVIDNNPDMRSYRINISGDLINPPKNSTTVLCEHAEGSYWEAGKLYSESLVEKTISVVSENELKEVSNSLNKFFPTSCRLDSKKDIGKYFVKHSSADNPAEVIYYCVCRNFNKGKYFISTIYPIIESSLNRVNIKPHNVPFIR